MDAADRRYDPCVERFQGYLTLLARAHLGRDHQAKIEVADVVQQTLLDAFQQRNQFRGQSDAELADWLKRILVNNLADAFRRLDCAKRDVRRERSLEAAIEDSISRTDGWLAANQTSPSQQAIRIEQLLRMAQEIGRLSEDQREVVVLHHLQGWSLTQLAEKLQRSESAVVGLLHRGLKKLRALMQDETGS
jgi:RNA polymerase sigma-70 factor (ECF subfamily)